MKTIRCITKSSVIALLTLLLPCSLMAGKSGPIIVSINDVPNGAPVIQVKGAPNGYDIYTGENVADPAIEDGALITLFGVDAGGVLADWGGRFVDPTPWQCLPPWVPYGNGVNYRQYRTAVDIVWVEHNFDLFGNGDLRVGFDSAHPGTWFWNPGLGGDENLGPATDNWGRDRNGGQR